jgi:hypothetical protein
MPDQLDSGGKPQESNGISQNPGSGPTSSIASVNGSTYREPPSDAPDAGLISHLQEPQQLSGDLKCDISCPPHQEWVKLEGLAYCAALKLGKERCVGMSKLGSDLFEFLFLLKNHISLWPVPLRSFALHFMREDGS